jgi:DNA-directed RNA polymerase alpha subunit
MTNREIKFELAKAALTGNKALDAGVTLEVLYRWIIEDSEVDVDNQKDYDKVSVREIIRYLVNNDRYSDKRYASSLINVFNDNGINTVGDILRLDRREFMRIKGVGKGSVTRIDDALEELYGIKDW